MKKIIFNLKTRVAFCCLFLISAFAVNAQTLSLGTTNAVSVSGPTISGGAYNYNVVIPFYATDLTGTFSLTYASTYTCGQGYFKYITLNKSTGAFVANSSNSNSVSIVPGNMPVGTNSYVMRVYCANGAPDLPSILKATLNINITVTKEAAPAVNLSFAPYCKYVAHSNPQVYSGYIGFNVSGNYANASKLYLRVTNTASACPTADYPLTYLNTSGSATATVGPGMSFYDCAANTAYTIQLVYKSGATVYIIPSGSYGWTNYTWTKTFKNCMNVLQPDPGPFEPAFGKTAATNEMAITDPNDQNRTNKKGKYSLYPIPVTTTLSVLPVEDGKLVSIRVYDFNGIAQVSKVLDSKAGLQQLDVTALKPGIYFAQIETSEGVFVEKIVKN